MTFKGQKLDWEFIGTWVFRVFMAGVAIGGMYATSIYVTKADAQVMVAPIQPLTVKVDRLETTSAEREKKWQDQDQWRRVKDETDVRLTVLQENQQQMLLRQQQMMDRQQSQIDELNRRK